MLEELKEKEVSIKTARWPAGSLKGKVIDVGDSWIKIQTKKKIEYINFANVSNINTKI
jgi:hypothetical protein